MTSRIRLKRTSTAGKTPALADLLVGELAINTRDGLLFTKINDGSDRLITLGAEMSSTVAAALKQDYWGDLFDALGVTNLLYRETPVAAAGQTQIGFSGGASWRDRVCIHFAGFSTSGTSPILIQLGDAGGYETTGYNATGLSFSGTGVAHASSANGFLLTPTAAGDTFSGTVILSRHGASTWIASGGVKRNATATALVFGDKTLSEVLSQVRITTANGTDTFDAGSVSTSWE